MFVDAKAHFRHSYVAEQALNTKQSQLQVPSKKLVQEEVATRWNSTLEMIECILEQYTALSAGKQKGTVKVLEPFAHATTMLYVEKIPSISVVQPFLRALEKKFLIITETDQNVSADMKTAINTSIHCHFQDCTKNKAMHCNSS